MTNEEHSKQATLCARFGLAFVLVSIAAHTIERSIKMDLDLGFTFLWVAVLMLTLGFLQHLKARNRRPSLPHSSSIVSAEFIQER